MWRMNRVIIAALIIIILVSLSSSGDFTGANKTQATDGVIIWTGVVATKTIPRELFTLVALVARYRSLFSTSQRSNNTNELIQTVS